MLSKGQVLRQVKTNWGISCGDLKETLVGNPFTVTQHALLYVRHNKINDDAKAVPGDWGTCFLCQAQE